MGHVIGSSAVSEAKMVSKYGLAQMVRCLDWSTKNYTNGYSLSFWCTNSHPEFPSEFLWNLSVRWLFLSWSPSAEMYGHLLVPDWAYVSIIVYRHPWASKDCWNYSCHEHMFSNMVHRVAAKKRVARNRLAGLQDILLSAWKARVSTGNSPAKSSLATPIRRLEMAYAKVSCFCSIAQKECTLLRLNGTIWGEGVLAKWCMLGTLSDIIADPWAKWTLSKKTYSRSIWQTLC